jgi:serine protease AprX
VVDQRLARASAEGGTLSVIVQGEPGHGRDVEQAVRATGGHATRALPIVDGVAATIPGRSLPALAGSGAVRAIAPDEPVMVRPVSDTAAAARPSSSQSPADPASSKPVTSVYPSVVGADRLWREGATGRGVTVALVDTGIDPVDDLAGRVLAVRDDLTGRVTSCVNISGEPDCTDSYGHGTFVAGIIAGNGAASNGAFRGIAPEANLLSVKIAGRDGSADVSGVLAAIQWVVSFKDRYDIRVLNLSLGTDSTQSSRVDPLNYGVERAWAAGVAVVVAASNRGPGAATISKPADDPFVITVGAEDDRGTVDEHDDRLPDFSGRGPTAADGLAKPDVVAPGAHLVSLRAKGSAIDDAFPSYVDASYRKGSGTSMSAAVVSGGAALLLQAQPDMSPDRLKFALMATARPVASTDALAVGSGLVDLHSAASGAPPGVANRGVAPSNGRGSLALSRGTVSLETIDASHTVLDGLLTAQLLLWDPLGYVTGVWSAPTWYLSPFYLGTWHPTGWHGSNWQGSNWQGSTWYGQADGTSTYGSNWQGSAWYGAWG